MALLVAVHFTRDYSLQVPPETLVLWESRAALACQAREDLQERMDPAENQELQDPRDLPAYKDSV